MSGQANDRSAGAPTLADVARLSGVSTATVSRCLNAPGRVAEETRRKVTDAVATLGYSPNFGARALAAKRTGTIGAIIPTMENAIFARGLQAFQEELRAHGVTMLVASSSYRADIEEEQIRALTARGADALLLIGHDRDEAIYAFLKRQGVPTLAAWVYDSAQQRVSIGFDNRAAMSALAQRVLDLGHRRIGMISAEVQQNDRARGRLLGLREAIEQTPGAELDIIETPYGFEQGGDAFEALMAKSPTAIVCGNDVLAVGALRRARAKGMRVPGDVSITGFDDIEIAQIADPALTTVHVPHSEMGRRAAQMLIAMVAGGAPESVRLETEIVQRGTLGPPPASSGVVKVRTGPLIRPGA